MQVDNLYREIDFFQYPNLHKALADQMKAPEEEIVLPNDLFVRDERSVIGSLKRLILRIVHAVQHFFSSNYRARFLQSGQEITSEIFSNRNWRPFPEEILHFFPEIEEPAVEQDDDRIQEFQDAGVEQKGDLDEEWERELQEVDLVQSEDRIQEFQDAALEQKGDPDEEWERELQEAGLVREETRAAPQAASVRANEEKKLFGTLSKLEDAAEDAEGKKSVCGKMIRFI